MTRAEIESRIADIRTGFLARPFLSVTERALCDLADQLVRDAWRLTFDRGGRLEAFPSAWAALAVGGYGRRELHPGSDLDFLFFCPDRTSDDTRVRRALAALAEIPFPAEGDGVTESDFLSFDSDRAFIYGAFLDARFLYGNLDAARTFTERVFPGFVERHRRDLILALAAVRTANLTGPVASGDLDLKHAPGGLADFRWIRWIGRLDSREGRLSAADYRDVEEAASLLRVVRTALNFLFPEAGSVLGRAQAPDVARAIGVSSLDQRCSEATRVIATAADELAQRFR